MAYKHKLIKISTKNQPKPPRKLSTSIDVEYELILKLEYALISRIIKTLSLKDQFILKYYMNDTGVGYSSQEIRAALNRLRKKYETWNSMRIHDL